MQALECMRVCVECSAHVLADERHMHNMYTELALCMQVCKRVGAYTRAGVCACVSSVGVSLWAWTRIVAGDAAISTIIIGVEQLGGSAFP